MLLIFCIGFYWVRRLLYHAEGFDGAVSVVDTGQQRLLVINGKADAMNRPGFSGDQVN